MGVKNINLSRPVLGRIGLIKNGERGRAEVANRPIKDLRRNTEYLQESINYIIDMLSLEESNYDSNYDSWQEIVDKLKVTEKDTTNIIKANIADKIRLDTKIKSTDIILTEYDADDRELRKRYDKVKMYDNNLTNIESFKFDEKMIYNEDTTLLTRTEYYFYIPTETTQDKTDDGDDIQVSDKYIYLPDNYEISTNNSSTIKITLTDDDSSSEYTGGISVNVEENKLTLDDSSHDTDKAAIEYIYNRPILYAIKNFTYDFKDRLLSVDWE